MPPMTVTFSQGRVTSRDAADLEAGELQQAEGIYYKPGDTGRAHKILGRTVFGDTGSGAKIKGIALCKFDTGGTDYLLAHSGTVIYSATPGTTGTFSSLVTGLDSSSSHMAAAHHNDRWFLCNGIDRNRVLNSAGSVYSMGMEAPAAPPTVASSNTTPADTYPTETDNGSPGFEVPTLAYDTNQETYSYAYRNSPSSATCTWKTWGTSGIAGRKLNILWKAETPSREDITVKIEVSTDSGSTWTTLVEERYNQWPSSQAARKNPNLYGAQPKPWARWINYSVPDAKNSNVVRVKATLTYNAGSTRASLNIYHICISATSAVAAFSTTTGLYYAVSEYDQNTGTESEARVSQLVTMSTKNFNTVTLPSAAVNSRATHWRIYRTSDGGSSPEGLYYLRDLAITETTYCDDFSVDKDEELPGKLPLLSIVSDTETNYYQQNAPPPTLSDLTYFKGHLVGLSPVNPRSLYYTPTDYPEYWPSIYVNTKFPISDHDVLVKCVDLGETMLVFASEAVFRITDLPEVIMGSFNDATVTVLKGQPGCVGKKAAVAFSLAGESQAMWVSPYGIHQTNGTICRRISIDQDWDSDVSQAHLDTAVLCWLSDIQCVLFAYDSDGSGYNNRYWLIHMGPEHSKASGLPKITGPHYGKIACAVSSLVSSEHRTYSGHSSNGKVYLEMNGTTDASNSYDANGTIPCTVKPSRFYGPLKLFGVGVASLRHTNWGDYDATVTWLTGRGQQGSSQSVTKSVSLYGAENTDFFVGRAGEWHEPSISLNSGSGAIQDLRFEVLPMGKAGEVRSN